MPWITPDNLHKCNPANPERLANFRHAPPTIVIHSDKDYRCPVTEGLGLFRTLQSHKVPSVFLYFPDECHWVVQEENSLQWHREVWSWVRKCVTEKVSWESFEMLKLHSRP